MKEEETKEIEQLMKDLFNLFDTETDEQEDKIVELIEAEIKYLSDEGFIKVLEDGTYDLKSEEDLACEIEAL